MMADLKRFFSEKQKVLVTFCFILFVINTQIKQTAVWYSQIYIATFHATEIIMSLLILSHYKVEEIKKFKWVYISYSAITVIIGAVYLYISFKDYKTYLFSSGILLVLGLYMIGFCAICLVISWVKIGRRVTVNKPAFILWFLLMFLMSISAGSYNFYALRFFLCLLVLYLTPQTEIQRKNVFDGMVTGLIVGFLCEFGFCLLFRPYDLVRYLGNFSNPNHNCLFLDFIYAAVLGGLLIAHKNESRKTLRILLYVILGIVLSNIYMTASRSGWLGAFAVTVLYMIFYGKIIGKNVLKQLLRIALVFMIGLPLTYAAIRYVPLTNPYVKLYYYDNHHFHSVLRENKFDQSNYISFTQMLFSPLGRFKVLFGVDAVSGDVDIPEAPAQDVSADMEPLLTAEEATDNIVVRYTIYRWYVEHLNLRGVPYEDQGFLLTSDHWIQDTHDIFLAYGMDYGVPAMILFACLIIYSVIYCIRKGIREKDVYKALAVMILIIPPVAGLFEFAWGYGLLSMNCLYFVMKDVVTVNEGSSDTSHL